MLQYIRERPEFWLTSKSISSLQNFLNGYLVRFNWADLQYDGHPPFDQFKYFILSKGPEGGGVGNPYSRVLLDQCHGDEEKAFDKFFEYLDEFKQESKKQDG